MKLLPWIMCAPTGGCLQWSLYVLAAAKDAYGHMEGDYVVDDFGDLVRLQHRQGFCAEGLHEYDDECLWLYWPHTILEAMGHRRPGSTDAAPAAIESVPSPVEPRQPLSKPQARVIARFRRQLERWELPHLRDLAATQAEQIEDLQAQLDAMTRRCHDAESSVDMWHHHAMELGDALRDAGAGQVGLTQCGELTVMRAQAAEARLS